MELSLLSAAGVFLWPLLICSALALFVATERALALTASRTVPLSYLQGSYPSGKTPVSPAARLLALRRKGLRGDALRRAAETEVVALQRGLFLLDSVVAIAPLLGLLGTVTGLAGVFVSGATPDPSSLAAGFGLALSTTVIGLGIAIPAQFAANWLYRRIEIVADQLASLAATLSETDPAP